MVSIDGVPIGCTRNAQVELIDNLVELAGHRLGGTAHRRRCIEKEAHVDVVDLEIERRLTTLLKGHHVRLRLAGIDGFTRVDRLTRVVRTGIVVVAVGLVIAAIVVIAVVVATAAVVLDVDLVDDADVTWLLVCAGREKKKEESEKSLVSMMFSPGWSAASLAASQPIKGDLDREFHHDVIFFRADEPQPPYPPKTKQKTATNRRGL